MGRRSAPGTRPRRNVRCLKMADFSDCHLWRTDTVPKDELDKLEEVETFLEDSHLMRRVKRCHDCGQFYFYEFYEEIDYTQGDDPQWRALIPVQSIAEARELAKGDVLHMTKRTPRIQWVDGRRYLGKVNGEPRYTDEPEIPHWVR